MPFGRPEIRHYDSAIASNSKRHALLNQPLKQLRQRTETLLDSITGASAAQAPDVARAAQLQKDLAKASTCRKCGVVFADVKGLGMHHNLFPDHAKVEKKVKRKHVPVRSQSEGDALDIAAAAVSSSSSRQGGTLGTPWTQTAADVPLSSADLYAPQRAATTTVIDEGVGLSLAPDASPETRALAARFTTLEMGPPSPVSPVQALPQAPSSPREQRNRLAGARSAEVLGRVTSSAAGSSSSGSGTPKESSSRRNSQGAGVALSQSSSSAGLRGLTNAILATARTGDSQPTPVDVNINLGLGKSVKGQQSPESDPKQQGTLIDLESPFDGLDLVAAKEEKKRRSFFPPSRSQSGDELTSATKGRTAPPPPPSRITPTTSFSDSPTVASPASTRSLPGLPRRLTNPFLSDKAMALGDDEDATTSPTSPSKARRAPPLVPTRRREGSEASLSGGKPRTPLSPSNPFASYFAGATAAGGSTSAATTMAGPDHWSNPSLPPPGSIAAPASPLPTLSPPRSPRIGGDAVSPARSSMRAGAFRERSGRASPSLGAGGSSSSLPYRRQASNNGAGVHFPPEVAARASDNPRCPTCDQPFIDLKAVLAHLDDGECGAEIDGTMGI